ncbi:unnamed protein product, partial [Iphiclides podalirius]
MLKSVAAQIARHTTLSRRHLTPEIALRLVTPSCPLWSAPAEESPFRDPFWASDCEERLRVIENQRKEHRHNQCNEVGDVELFKRNHYKLAIQASKINAEMNGVAIETSTDNMIGSDVTEFDVALIGDMFYDEEFSNVLFEWLKILSGVGKMVG